MMQAPVDEDTVKPDAERLRLEKRLKTAEESLKALKAENRRLRSEALKLEAECEMRADEQDDTQACLEEERKISRVLAETIVQVKKEILDVVDPGKNDGKCWKPAVEAILDGVRRRVVHRRE